MIVDFYIRKKNVCKEFCNLFTSAITIRAVKQSIVALFISQALIFALHASLLATYEGARNICTVHILCISAFDQIFCSSVGQSERLLTVRSQVRVLPEEHLFRGPTYFFEV